MAAPGDCSQTSLQEREFLSCLRCCLGSFFLGEGWEDFCHMQLDIATYQNKISLETNSAETCQFISNANLSSHNKDPRKKVIKKKKIPISHMGNAVREPKSRLTSHSYSDLSLLMKYTLVNSINQKKADSRGSNHRRIQGFSCQLPIICSPSDYLGKVQFNLNFLDSSMIFLMLDSLAYKIIRFPVPLRKVKDKSKI